MSPQPFHYRRRLPHWRVDDAIYFVTWRLAKGQPELEPIERDLVRQALESFSGARYRLYAFVVMNDHVHVLVEPRREYSLQSILHSWKSFTSNRMQRESQRRGQIWQDEYFDRVVRDQAEFEEKRGYILGNPFKRWAEIEFYDWLWTGTEND